VRSTAGNVSFNPNVITIPEIYDIHFALTLGHGLPDEVAAEILDLAEYWYKQRHTLRIPTKLEATDCRLMLKGSHKTPEGGDNGVLKVAVKKREEE
jgi:hypothetical protein